MPLEHHATTQAIIAAFLDVYKQFHNAIPETFCTRAIAAFLEDHQVPVAREVPVHVPYRGRTLGVLRIDLVVNDAVVVECKRVPRVLDTHRMQLLGYLHATPYEHGLLLNFGPTPDYKRVVSRKTRRTAPEHAPAISDHDHR